jgi:hypothetical protein
MIRRSCRTQSALSSSLQASRNITAVLIRSAQALEKRNKGGIAGRQLRVQDALSRLTHQDFVRRKSHRGQVIYLGSYIVGFPHACLSQEFLALVEEAAFRLHAIFLSSQNAEKIGFALHGNLVLDDVPRNHSSNQSKGRGKDVPTKPSQSFSSVASFDTESEFRSSARARAQRPGQAGRWRRDRDPNPACPWPSPKAMSS